MAFIIINTKYPKLYDGMPITFKAPCDCAFVEGLTVNSTNFIFKDANRNTLTGIGNLFSEGALVKAILDKTNGFAYIQNADNNKYLEDRISAAETSVNINRKSIEANSANISRNDKRITTIEAVVYGDLAQETEDNTVAYVKDVPSNARGTAKLNTLGGMTRKCAQVWDEQWSLGYYDVNTGAFTADSGFFASKNKFSVLPNTEYSVTCSTQRRIVFYDANKNYLSGIDYNSNPVITTPSDCYYMAFSLWSAYGVEYKNDIMINKGSTALPYEPYFEGLRSALVMRVESVGANLVPFPYAEGNTTRAGVTFTVADDGKITINGTATGLVNFVLVEENTSFLPPNANISLSLKNGTGSVYLVTGGASSALPLSYSNNYSATVSSDGVLGYCLIQIPAGTVVSNLTVCPMINKGATAQPYRPYTRNTLPIPKAVQALDGYGEGVNESVYNYIDYEKKQFVKRVGKVDMGTLAWQFANTVALIALNDMSLTPQWIASTMPSKIKQAAYDGTTPIFYLFFDDGAYTSLDQLREDLQGVMLYYELATPEVTDISDILPADNYIGVEGGGTLTFKNQFEFDVPSEITYITKGATV